MNRKTILLGVGAAAMLALAGTAQAQVLGGGVTGQVGVTGQIAAPIPAVPTDRAVGVARGAVDTTAATARRAKDRAAATAGRTTATARDAASTGADASATATASASFPVGTVVRDSAGVQIGTVMDPKEGMAADGRVAIRTSSGFITVPASSLSLQGDVAVSAQTSAEIGKPQP